MQIEQLQAISMLVAMETKESLTRGVIMVITKKLAWHVQTYNRIYRSPNSLWSCTEVNSCQIL